MTNEETKSEEIAVVEIDSVAFGGAGVARDVHGKVYFVTGGIPGDKVEVEVTRSKKSFSFARISRFVKKSPLRGSSPCPYYGTCGGCQWLDVPYEKQLEWKSKLVKEQFEKNAKKAFSEFSSGNPLKVSINPSGHTLHYRSRISLRVYHEESGKLRFGYFKIGSKTLVGIDRCAIACETINNFLTDLASFHHKTDRLVKFRMEIQYVPFGRVTADKLNNFSVKGTPIFSGSEGGPRLTVLLTPAEGALQDLNPYIDFIDKLADVTMVEVRKKRKVQDRYNYLKNRGYSKKQSAKDKLKKGELSELEASSVKWVPTDEQSSLKTISSQQSLRKSFSSSRTAEYAYMMEHDGQNPYLVSPGGFYQVNLEANLNLRKYVLEKIEKWKPFKIYDIFCGTGNLSLQLLSNERYVEGVELSPSSIECALSSAAYRRELNPGIHYNFYSQDALKQLKQHIERKTSFDAVILDPPREGFYDGVKLLSLLKPQHILYVSCDPSTLARDSEKLVESGYKIQSIEAFDFFPATYHVETVVCFEV